MRAVSTLLIHSKEDRPGGFAKLRKSSFVLAPQALDGRAAGNFHFFVRKPCHASNQPKKKDFNSHEGHAAEGFEGRPYGAAAGGGVSPSD